MQLKGYAEMKENQRDSFSSKVGFILTCVGAAVGLGNLWMFSWRLGKYGGAAFLIPYLFFVYVLGTTGLVGEFGFGRWAKKGAMGAYDKVLRLKGLRFGRGLGAYPVLATWGVLIFYAIVAGWVLRYLFSSFGGGWIRAESIEAYFNQFAGQPVSILWQAAAIVFSGGFIALGIAKGIERASKFFMPILLVIFAILMVRSLTLPGAMEGVKYLLIPDWSYLLKPITWGMALGQAFFSVTLTGCGMLVYGSYLDRDADLPNAALNTVTLDTIIAIVASLIIIPAAFAYGIDPASGPPLLFITVLEIFSHIPGGQLISILFFIGVLFAAVTSLFIMMETVVEAGMDQFKINRKLCMAIVAVITFAFGLPLAVDIQSFTRFVDIVTIYFVPLAAVIAAVLFFWVFSIDKARTEINAGAKRPIGKWWEPVAKYFFVGVSILIIVLQMVYKIGG